MPGKILNLKETGKVLGVTDRTIQNLIERGELRGFQVGARWRVEESDIAAYIEQQKERAATIEARQPGQIALIAEFVSLFPEDERKELEQWIIGALALNPEAKAHLNEHGLIIGSLAPDGPVTVSVTPERSAELAASRK